MSARWKTLAQRIRLECSELDESVSTVARHWQRAVMVTEDQDAFLNSVALNLHSLYSGLGSPWKSMKSRWAAMPGTLNCCAR